MKNRAKVISELVAINHGFATFDSDIFTIELLGDKLKLYPRDQRYNNVFYRMSQVSKVLNDHGATWYVSTTRTGAIEVTAW